jgi:hypothetical protein
VIAPATPIHVATRPAVTNPPTSPPTAPPATASPVVMVASADPQDTSSPTVDGRTNSTTQDIPEASNTSVASVATPAPALTAIGTPTQNAASVGSSDVPSCIKPPPGGFDQALLVDVDVYLAADGAATRVSNTVPTATTAAILHSDYSRCNRGGSWIRIHVEHGIATLMK